MHTQVVNHNGFQFLFKTYDNEDLRNLQFFFIESELVQATGRARALRNPVVVKLFSNYPLPEAAISESENAIAQKKLEVARARGHLEKSYLGLPHQLEIRF